MSGSYVITREGKMKVVNKNIDNLKMPKGNSKRSSANLVSRLKDKIIKPDEIKSEAHFILLVAINFFLSGDYEYCFRVCSRNFTYLVNSPLFEGNVRRFRAMAAEKLFFHQRVESGVDLSMLIISIESAS